MSRISWECLEEKCRSLGPSPRDSESSGSGKLPGSQHFITGSSGDSTELEVGFVGERGAQRLGETQGWGFLGRDWEGRPGRAGGAEM